MKSTLIIVIVLVLEVTATPGTAQIVTRYFDPEPVDEANWGDNVWRPFCGSPDLAAGDWDCSDGDCHAAVICPGKTCNLTDERDAQSLGVDYTVAAGDGILDIESGGLLNLVQDNGTSDIDGVVNIWGTLEIDWEEDSTQPGEPYDHTILGDGELIGQTSSARMKVRGAGTTIPNKLHLRAIGRGLMEIRRIVEDTKAAQLVLEGGEVHADANGLLLIALSGLADENFGNSLLKVSTNANAVLEIDLMCSNGQAVCSAMCLNYTDVEVLKGILRLREEILTTEKKLTMQPGGQIELTTASAGARFQAPTTACP